MSNDNATKSYGDARDESSLTARPLRVQHQGKPTELLRLSAWDTVDNATVDLNRESVKALVEQATKWLEDTEVKLPTTPGSIVRADTPGVGNPPHAILHDDGYWYGASGKWALDPSVWVYGWVLIHDAARKGA